MKIWILIENSKSEITLLYLNRWMDSKQFDWLSKSLTEFNTWSTNLLFFHWCHKTRNTFWHKLWLKLTMIRFLQIDSIFIRQKLSIEMLPYEIRCSSLNWTINNHSISKRFQDWNPKWSHMHSITKCMRENNRTKFV